jgi:hypothetical protein
MRVAIRFADNDFYNTLMPFMKVLAELIYHRDEDENPITKMDIVNLFNATAYSIYMFCQHRPNDQSHEHLKTYLTIEARNVFIDGEIDKKLETMDPHIYKGKMSYWDNGEFFYADFDNLQFGCY